MPGPMTPEERLAAVENLFRTAHTLDNEALVSHEALAAVLDHQPPSPSYYGVIADVRAALLSEDIVFENVHNQGYRSLRADQHGDSARSKFTRLVGKVEVWTERAKSFVRRVEGGEEPGVHQAEYLSFKNFVGQAEAAVDNFRGQQDALNALTTDVKKLVKEEAAVAKLMSADGSKAKRIREEKQKTITSLRGKLSRHEKALADKDARIAELEAQAASQKAG